MNLSLILSLFSAEWKLPRGSKLRPMAKPISLARVLRQRLHQVILRTKNTYLASFPTTYFVWQDPRNNRKLYYSTFKLTSAGHQQTFSLWPCSHSNLKLKLTKNELRFRQHAERGMRNWLFSYSVPTNNDKLNLRKSLWTHKKSRWEFHEILKKWENCKFFRFVLPQRLFFFSRPGSQEEADGSLPEWLKRLWKLFPSSLQTSWTEVPRKEENGFSRINQILWDLEISRNI